MPRALDPDARRREITRAATELLARGGSKALTIKALAESLGGSTTLVTHVFPHKSDIYAAIIDELELDLRSRVTPAAAYEQPVQALREFVSWCLPLDPADLEDERVRFALFERADHDSRVQAVVDAIDDRMRDLLHERLAPLVPAEMIPAYTDLLRALTNGAILGAVELPDRWTPQRQEAVVSSVLDGLGFRLKSDQR
jgi:AcrR family transcriptional regulator